MAIQWAGNSTLRIGVNIFTDGYDTWTPSINVYCDIYVGSDNYDYGDNQTITLSGSVGGTFNFFNDLPKAPGAVKYVGRAQINGQGQSYGGGPTYTFSLRLTGAFNGQSPSGTWYFTLPPRPIRPPSPPGAPSAGSITGTGASITWGAPSDVGGSGLDYSWLQVGLTNFGSLIYDNQTPGWSGRTLTGLAPGTTYYMRAAAHNAAGWSGMSGVSSFVTNAFQVPLPTGSFTASNATITWKAPGVGPAPTGYELQHATNSSFTGATTLSGGWATSRTISGLVPGTAYWFRVRANSGSGWGAWSSAITQTTSSYQLAAPSVVVQAVTADLSWSNPPTSDAPTRYDIQVAQDANFTASLQTISSTTWANSRTVTGLKPGTQHWFRVRAGTASGMGAYSPATSVKTLSGAKIRVNGAWVDAIAYARVGGVWKQVLVQKRVGGAWVQ